MKNSKKFRFVAVAVSVWVICSVCSICNLFSFWENKSYDNRMLVTSEYVKSSDKICFIAVDQESIDWAKENKGWSWPWPRKAWGDIVRYMNMGNASSVLFDVLYTEPSVYGDTDDNDFAEACTEYGRVVQTMFVTEDTELFPVEQIRQSAALLANITSAKDSDDIIRRARLSFTHDGKEYPSLGLAPAVIDGNTINDVLESIPTQRDGTALLRYRKSIDEYLPYRASDILSSYDSILNNEEPLVPLECFEDSDVFVAYYAPGLFDICSTPVSQVYPGVGVHITSYDNYLNDSFIKKVPTFISLIYLLLVSFLGVLVIRFSTKQKSQGFTVLCMLGGVIVSVFLILGIGYGLFILNLWIILVPCLVCFVLSFGSELFLSFIFEGKQKRFIKSAFSQYLSPVVIDQLILNPGKLKLGGEKREISIYFSDVQGFTSISEKLNPEQLTEVLNEYLSEMTDIILKSGGTIDKYEGDALIAFWNAPADEEDHANRAMLAAMECQRRLEEIRPRLFELSGGKVFQRIGINTGYAVVGNMGSKSRFDYTMLGDSVNLASRLEGLNKQFGTYTMCSEATMEQAIKFGSTLNYRRLARVAVVGKKEAVTVYEPMERKEYESKKEQLEVFNKGYQKFYDGEFSQALKIFESQKEKDAPCNFYAEKCKELLNTPNLEWDGVWHTSTK